jgi:uncharacterized OB-fold protein
MLALLGPLLPFSFTGAYEMSEFTVNSFKETLENGAILGSKCEKCGNLMLPPRIICNKCGSWTLSSYEYKHRGTLEAFSKIHVPITEFQEKCPYTVGIIELFEGPKISGIILNDEKIEVGSKVEAVFLKEEKKTTLAFRAL